MSKRMDGTPHRIVIVGGGAGGLELATRLGRKFGRDGKAEITLIDSKRTHIWKPKLHEIAAGSMDIGDHEVAYLAQAHWHGFRFRIGQMTGLDRRTREVHVAPFMDEDGKEVTPARSFPYDTLVIAVGSQSNDFGTPGVREHALKLETVADARRFHMRMVNACVRAHAQRTPLRPEQLHVAIIGAGATGVELAAELHNAAHELAAYGLDRIKPENMHITLIEAGPRVLPALPDRIGGPVHKTLEKLGVTVLTNSAVSEVTADSLITKDGQVIPASLKVWAAGIRAPGFLQEIAGLETNRINQLVVRPTLQTTRDDNIFAFGDCAACPQPGTDKLVPPRAQAAHQQASLLAKSLKLRIEGKAQLPDYKYRDYGSLISLSSFSAVGNLMGSLMGTVMLEGWLARMFYISLYRMHQMALYGTFRTLMLMLGSRIGRGTEPRLKLH